MLTQLAKYGNTNHLHDKKLRYIHNFLNFPGRKGVNVQQKLAKSWGILFVDCTHHIVISVHAQVRGMVSVHPYTNTVFPRIIAVPRLIASLE